MVELEVKEMTCGHCDQGRVRVESGNSPAQRVEALGEAGYPAAVATAPAPSAGARKGSCCGCGA